MKNLRFIVLTFALCCLALPTISYGKKKKPKCGATGFDDCPAKGCGGDSLLNKRKNTAEMPVASETEKFKRSDFVKLKFPAS